MLVVVIVIIVIIAINTNNSNSKNNNNSNDNDRSSNGSNKSVWNNDSNSFSEMIAVKARPASPLLWLTWLGLSSIATAPWKVGTTSTTTTDLKKKTKP